LRLLLCEAFFWCRIAITNNEWPLPVREEGAETYPMADKKPRGGAPKKPSKTAPKTSAAGYAGMEKHIGSQLKALYDDMVAEPIPDRLLDLLNRLDDKAAKG
jgi:Anti-sigma factor NepR